MKKIKTLYITTLILLLLSSNAFAQVQHFGEILDKVSWQLKGTSPLFQAFCYIAGLIITITGLFKAKEATQGGGRATTKDWVAFLVAGALIIAVPAVIHIMVASTVGTEGSLNIVDMDF